MANQLLSFCPPRGLAGFILAALTAFFGALPAHATLFDRGGGLIYDDVLDVTAFGITSFQSISDVSGNTVIQIDADDSVTLIGVNSADFHADDVLF